MSYPVEKDKGLSFTVFWTIFQLGTLVGSAIALGIEANSTLPSVSTGVYLAFMIIMLTSIFTSWLLLPPRECRNGLRNEMHRADGMPDLIVRGDGTIPLLEDAISPKQEFRAFIQLFKDRRMIFLL